MYQEPTVFQDLSVAENIFAGRHPKTPLGTVDWRAMRRETERVLTEFGVDIGPDTPGAGPRRRRPAAARDRQGALDERARADHGRADGGALATRGREPLRDARGLRERGVAIVFISHRLEEVRRSRTSSRCSATDSHVATRPIAEPRRRRSCRLMVGRSLDALFPKEEAEIGEVVLEATRLHPPRGLLRRLVRGCAAARSSAWPASSAPAAPRSRAALFGIDPSTKGRLLDRRIGLPATVAPRGAAPRARVPPRGPARPGTRAGDVDRDEHRPWPSCPS